MTALPVASAADVRRYARRLTREHRRPLGITVLLQGLAAASGLVTPRLLGELVEKASRGAGDVTGIALLILLFVVAQAAFMGLAALAAAVLGEKVLAGIRVRFVEGVLALPLPVAEQAGTGDLVTRSTRDPDMLSHAVRQAVPDTVLAATTIMLTAGALLLVNPLLMLPSLVSVPVLWFAARWYLARARDGYLRENASYAQMTEGLMDTVEGARTVEALAIGHRRIARMTDDIAVSYGAQRYTLGLRTVFLPVSDVSYILPVVATLIIGGLLYIHGLVTLAAVVAAVLYVQQLIGPVDTLLYWLNELQVGGAAMARLLGPQPPVPARQRQDTAPPPPRGRGQVAVRGVSYAYRDGRDVLHDVDLRVEPGERLAIVGASGAGKSTLGRLLAGVYAPRSGSVTIDGASLSDLTLDQLRGRVALVTQEYHVFSGPLRDNLIMARPGAGDAELRQVMAALGAWEWAERIGLGTRVGSGGVTLTPAQGQQLALARLALANPRTFVLDEATALLAPQAARQIERSLTAVLTGRTVIAIAHRLHTAHDADRIAVMDAGRVIEIGSHHTLVSRGGAYAALWRSWHETGR